jgi:hypothetical protein
MDRPPGCHTGLEADAAGFIGLESRAENPGEPVTFIDRLLAIPPGKADWARCQRVCQEISGYLFCPPLRSPLHKNSDLPQINRRDFILPNYAPLGTWHFLRQQYRADFVDAKNYTVEIGKNAVPQVANYLKPHGVGLFAIIICRVAADSAALNTVREQWAQHNKMLIILQDTDILQMLTHKASGGDPVEMTMQRIKDFRLSMPPQPSTSCGRATGREASARP